MDALKESVAIIRARIAPVPPRGANMRSHMFKSGDGQPDPCRGAVLFRSHTRTPQHGFEELLKHTLRPKPAPCSSRAMLERLRRARGDSGHRFPETSGLSGLPTRKTAWFDIVSTCISGDVNEKSVTSAASTHREVCDFSLEKSLQS
jgi:hypothetical protein